MAVKADINISKGTNLSVNFTVSDSAGTRINLTLWDGELWNVRFTLGSLTKTSETPAEINLTDPAQGEGTLFLIPTDTENLIGSPAYKLDIYSATRVYTFLCGRIKFICPCNN